MKSNAICIDIIFHMCYIVLMSLKHAILGFLSLEPVSGYTLRQRFEGSVSSFWSVTQSQVYRELKALESEDFVHFELIPRSGKPPRKVYSLTDAGREELARWLQEPVAPQKIRHPLLLKLAFSDYEDTGSIVKLLETYLRDLEGIERTYQERKHANHIFSLARSPQQALLWRLILENGLSWVRAESGWAHTALGELRKHMEEK